MPILNQVYVLVSDGLSEAQGRTLNEAIFESGGRIAVLVSPEIVIVQGDEDVAAAVGALVGNGVRAVGVDDVSPLIGVAALDGSPQTLAQLAFLAGTVLEAIAAADAIRTGQDEDWTGLPDTFGGE